MLLHGLFNTLGKKGFEVSQVALWAVSFLWLAYLIRSSRKRESGILEAANAGPMVVRTAQGTRIVQR